jgi:hypothetical protein
MSRWRSRVIGETNLYVGLALADAQEWRWHR